MSRLLRALCLSTLFLCTAATSEADAKLLPNDAAAEILAENTADKQETAGNSTTVTTGGRAFLPSVSGSFMMILSSELLDKTFFIAVVLAMRHSRIVVYAGAMTALGLMTVVAVAAGYLTSFIPRWITYYASAVLMLLFGLKMFWDAYHMKPELGQEEFDEVEKEVNEREKNESSQLLVVEGAPPPPTPSPFKIIIKVFIETFMLTFLAEWGDRSQVATVILAATDNVYGVLLGGVVGHALCTGIAVLGGKLVSEKITVRTVTIISGCVFIIFAVAAVVFNDVNAE